MDFGIVGQGYVHLSTLASAEGPWLRIGDWIWHNPPCGGISMQPRTQIGRLENVMMTALNPGGWGFYSDNAYLHGIVRTPNAILSDEGVIVYNVIADQLQFPGRLQICA